MAGPGDAESGLTPRDLNDYDRSRYDRQMMVDGWGEEGQQRLAASTVFIAGVGGLGSPVSIYLAAAGVGRLVLCDIDVIDLSNLNRQVLYADADVGQPKASVAAAALRRLNEQIEIVEHVERMTADNIDDLAGSSDLIVDCLDNFPTRYVLNELCLRQGMPLVHAGVWGLQAQVAFLQPPQTACLQCLFPEAPPPSKFPVVGAAPGVAGCLQAMEALKYLAGVGTNLTDRLLMIDGLDGGTRSVRLRRDPSCPACSGTPI
ncbi:MAG: HesA/MoeB/ThiF family protein [Gemmatimonadetes bacterium]|jgi:molybdopterin-synthase adenylyltransferase|nr:HesA/MoeB/ThiF family protein [Gemmatimonadota bacterium]MBT6148231.1 HesA/MoeB/ThiF family protein [Gemmatimonadota bacterium]MBT7860350.1 HesA/MoeB/ThiF family protein [Gemmatimonadota bacterium]